MRPFVGIATPHRDILEGKLTEDVFAADLWEVFMGRGPDDYRDPDVFFRKTFLTEGMRNLLEIAERRLRGEGGDPVIQLQTPFGGGKTHSLIALYHRARADWKVNLIVLDGTALDPREKTPWGEMERQLTGRVDSFGGMIPPGREKLRSLFEAHQPLLILIDELLQYTTKAAGVRVGDSTLAAQVLAFMHELTGAVRSLDRTLLVLTLPTSLLERYDESAERLFQQLQKIMGRMEKVYTPVQDREVASVIRRRLISSVDDSKIRENVEEFLEYAEKEAILPSGVEKSEYRKKFVESYPFQPEVIEVLYHRWGSFPTFQRTRGVLRLLALVLHSLKDSENPFVRLSDFDLSNEEIRRELVKHIGSQYDSVIASDITSDNSGAKKVDRALGTSYIPYRFGTKVATAIFLYSFSGHGEVGATLGEIKLSCAEVATPSSIIVEAISKLKDTTFFLQVDERLYFSDQPNLNRILMTKMENVSDEDMREEERKALEKALTKKNFKIYIWPQSATDIPDDKELKLVVLDREDREMIDEFLESYGKNPRVYRNTMIFLCPAQSERARFNEYLRRKIAWKMIEKDKTLTLSERHRNEVKEKIRKSEEEAWERLRNLYRRVYLPARDGLKELDLGIYVHGASKYIDDDVLEKLKGDGELLERMTPLFLKDRYLKDRDYVNARNLLESFYRTPGERRITSENVLRECIREGVKEGTFGYGILENGKPVCHHFKEEFSPGLEEGDVLIRPELCEIEKGALKEVQPYEAPSKEVLEVREEVLPPTPPQEGLEREMEVTVRQGYRQLNLVLNVPPRKMSEVVRVMNFIWAKFREARVRVEISAREGFMTHKEYEEKIKETINQAGIEIEEENFQSSFH